MDIADALQCVQCRPQQRVCLHGSKSMICSMRPRRTTRCRVERCYSANAGLRKVKIESTAIGPGEKRNASFTLTEYDVTDDVLAAEGRCAACDRKDAGLPPAALPLLPAGCCA